MKNSNTPSRHNCDARLDEILRQELRWHAPPDLTARLIALAPQATAPRPQATSMALIYSSSPCAWYRILVMILTLLSVVLSLAAAWRLHMVVGTELGIIGLWQQIELTGAIWFQWLAERLPFLDPLATAWALIHDQLHWALIAAIIWVAIDNWPASSPLQRQQA